MKKATAKSLAKTAVLDASDKPEDQDEARKRRVKMDFASWRKQTKAGKTTHQEEVGISSAAAMEKARREALLRKKEQDAVKKEKEALKKEEVQERTLDTFEKNKKEEIVKGMKKDTKGFKKRYGTEWKSVMYATATKQAKKAGDTSKSDERYASEETKMPGVSDKDKTYIKQRGKNLFKKDLKGTIPEGRMDKDPPSQFEKGDDDRGNPAYMKSVSYSDEEKWKRLQKMRKASKKKEVRAKAVDESATNPKKFSMKKFARGLEKEYGKGSVISKYTEKPKPQPQKKREPEKDTRSPEQREVDAQYGRSAINKKGSLGT